MAIALPWTNYCEQAEGNWSVLFCFPFRLCSVRETTRLFCMLKWMSGSTANLNMTSVSLALASMQTNDKLGKEKVTTTHLVNKNF